MSDLVGFLRARLAEDRAWADNPEYAEDPARVLREVEAKRRRITLALALIEQETDSPAATLMMRHAGEEMLRIEALPYADREEFDDAWRV